MATIAKKKRKKSRNHKNRHSPKPKKKVKDIAALFGPQISTKKVKTAAKSIRPRRNSETLRLQKKKLKNIKPSKNTKNECNSYDIALKSRDTSQETISITNITPMACIPTETANEIETDMDHIHDNEVDLLEFDKLLKETYGRRRRSSQSSSSSRSSSFLSCISLSALDLDFEPSPGYEARGSVCNDMDRDSIAVSEECGIGAEETVQSLQSKRFYTDELFMDVGDDTYQQQIEENKKLSQQIIMMDGAEDINVNKLFDMSDIGEIGAIKSSDYCNYKTAKEEQQSTTPTEMDQFAMDQFYIDSDDEYYSSGSRCNGNGGDADIDNNNGHDAHSLLLTDDKTENAFKQRRESQIEIDLFDLMISDESSADNDSPRNSDKTPIGELLATFGLLLFRDSNIYNYFSNILCIHFCYEILNILPHQISKPVNCCNIKQLMKLNKMVQHISRNVYNNISPWETPGKYIKEWIEVEYNRIAQIFQPNSPYLVNYNQYDYDFHADEDGIISLNGYETQYIGIDVPSFDDKEATYKLIVKQLPNKYRFEPKLFKFGVEIEDDETDEIQSLYVTDRLTIHKNENYLQSMFLGKFVENESFLFMTVSLSKLHGYLDINLCHDPNLQITTFDHTTFNKHFALKINEDAVDAKLFITQYNGNGQYVVKKL